MISKINRAASATEQSNQTIDQQQATATTPAARRVATLRRLRWLLIPLLAISAYLSVLRVGFLSDDYLTLYAARRDGLSLSFLQPDPTWFFYRPISYLLTWLVGWQLWGLNPLPYHVLGLLLHAATALLLGLAVAQVSRASTGLLAGCIFAVFPLHLETVAWAASQWDLWAAFFGLLSLYLFTRWWKQPQPAPYIAALIAYSAGVYSKESMFPFLPVFALAAWLINKRLDRPLILRVGLALIPFALALLSNLAIRLVTWGNIGGYQDSQPRLNDIWDRLLIFLHILLAPINTEALGQPIAQIVGLLSSVFLLVGLVLYGRAHWRLLLTAAAWIVLCLLPVLSLAVGTANLTSSRFFYLASAGYCFGLAVLLQAAIAAAKKWRRLLSLAVITALLLSVAITWLQLQPWHTATLQVQDIEKEVRAVFPPQPPQYNHTWYTENVPDTYKGVFLLRLGFGALRAFTSGDSFYQVNVPSAADAPLFKTNGDAFAVLFNYDQQSERFHVDYAAAITSPPDAPGPAERGANFTLWDFTNCDKPTLKQWQESQVKAQCVPGQGLVMQAQNDDQQMLLRGLNMAIDPGSAKFLRLRVSMSVGQFASDPPAVSELLWMDQQHDTFSADRHLITLLRQDQQTHTYWSFLQPASFSGALTTLRFDPINRKTDSVVRWIALDVVQ